MTVKNRYPLATADGTAIPNDTIRPRYAFGLAISGTNATTGGIPAGYETVVLYSTIDCVVRFGNVAAPLTSSFLDEAMFLPKGTLVTVSPSVLNFIHSVAIGGTGTLYITVVEPWAGLALELQTTRR